MKSLRLMLCAMPLMLTGCSTMSSVNWSAANPWNWFGSSTKVSEQGVGELTASTPLQEQAIADALDGDYRLRSGMKTANGNVVRFFEVMKGDNVAMVINGDQGTISRIDVLDSDIPADTGVKIGTPFSDLYSKAFGNCQKADGDDNRAVECKAEGSQHISYRFSGEWRGSATNAPNLVRLLTVPSTISPTFNCIFLSWSPILFSHRHPQRRSHPLIPCRVGRARPVPAPRACRARRSSSAGGHFPAACLRWSL